MNYWCSEEGTLLVLLNVVKYSLVIQEFVLLLAESSSINNVLLCLS